MRKTIVAIFMLFYCTGTMLLPLGDFACSIDLSAVYDQCKAEDPDINPVDFVFEHLLNLESLMEHFEGDADEENEKPHAPFQQLQSLSQTLVVVNGPMWFEMRHVTFTTTEEKTYPLHPDEFLPSDFLKKIFHPPSA